MSSAGKMIVGFVLTWGCLSAIEHFAGGKSLIWFALGFLACIVLDFFERKSTPAKDQPHD